MTTINMIGELAGTPRLGELPRRELQQLRTDAFQAFAEPWSGTVQRGQPVGERARWQCNAHGRQLLATTPSGERFVVACDQHSCSGVRGLVRLSAHRLDRGVCFDSLGLAFVECTVTLPEVEAFSGWLARWIEHAPRGVVAMPPRPVTYHLVQYGTLCRYLYSLEGAQLYAEYCRVYRLERDGLLSADRTFRRERGLLVRALEPLGEGVS